MIVSKHGWIQALSCFMLWDGAMVCDGDVMVLHVLAKTGLDISLLLFYFEIFTVEIVIAFLE